MPERARAELAPTGVLRAGPTGRVCRSSLSSSIRPVRETRGQFSLTAVAPSDEYRWEIARTGGGRENMW